MTSKGQAERFWSAVVSEKNGCWAYPKGYLTPEGYRIICYGRDKGTGIPKKTPAHRFAYKLVNGQDSIPARYHLDHLCRNRWCVNPGHLEPVTSRVNTLRGEGHAAHNARKTHCKHGHRLYGNNLYRYKHYRYCRTCKSNQARRARAAAHAAQLVRE